MEKKFRLFLLLALLLTATTGAWATDYTTLAVGDVIKVGDTFSPTAEGAFNDFGFHSGTYTLMRADVDNDGNVTEKTDGAYYVFKYVTDSNPYIHFGKAFAVTAISDGLEVTNIETGKEKGNLYYTLAVHEPTAAGYTVSLKDGVKDAGKWTVKAGTDGSFQSLPLEGVKAGTKVKLKYDGDRSMLKGVTAVKKAAVNPNAYMKWDNTKKELVATEMPESFTTVTSSTTTWEAGTYVVEGQVTISGMIDLKGDVNLIIKDGAKLTVNSYINGDFKNLSIYGQAKKTGQLVVNCSNNHAISGLSTLEVHSAEVTATASGNNSHGGISSIDKFNVYGGLVDAKTTAADGGYGISLSGGGSMDIYGGEVKAEGKGTGDWDCGIVCGAFSGAIVTVHGGKLWAGNADNKALNYIDLQKGDGFTGKIETSDNNTAWTEYTTTGTPDTKYVRVGY
jgi:hypothetical protein